MFSIRLFFSLLLCLLVSPVLVSCSEQVQGDATEKQANPSQSEEANAWTSYLTASQVAERLEAGEVLLIDVRKQEEYLVGHLPGAINMPGKDWRTPKAKPGEGDSQYIFLTAAGQPDVARYEAMLSAAGVKNSHQVVIYGNHAGKTDGTIPAMILNWLGHEKVAFLNGIGVEEWQKAGYELTQEPRTLEPSEYQAAAADPKFVWDLEQVLLALENDSVIFIDTRSEAEYTGEDKRSNARGGHIPGAIRLDYADLLDPETKRVLQPELAKKLLLERGITPDKTLALYCQTSTRVSLHALALKDLGYEKVVVYDASWHEYGNRDDTPVVQ